MVWSAHDWVGPYQTGVGKHIVHMVRGLAASPGFDVGTIQTAEVPLEATAVTFEPLLRGAPIARIPLRRRWVEGLWRAFDRPRVDRWVGEVDWVYCPRELYLPVRKSRYAMTVHDLYHLEPDNAAVSLKQRLKWQWTMKRALAQAEVVLAVSEFTKSRVVALFDYDPDRIHVVGNGVEADFFVSPGSGRSASDRRTHERHVLSVGGLTRKKGAPALLGLADALRERVPRLKLVCVGPVEAEFRARAGTQPNLRVLDRGISNRRLRSLLGTAVASVTLSEYEGFGIPVLEAMASGVPVIAARGSGLTEAVGGGGILVERDDADGIAETIARLSANRLLRSYWVRKGREHARRHTWEQCVSRLCAVLARTR